MLNFNKARLKRAHILYDSIYMTFLKSQKYSDEKDERLPGVVGVREGCDYETGRNQKRGQNGRQTLEP